MRGGIAERGGIRVGHRIIEINGQSVVATPHDKIIQILTNAVGEVRWDEMLTCAVGYHSVTFLLLFLYIFEWDYLVPG